MANDRDDRVALVDPNAVGVPGHAVGPIAVVVDEPGGETLAVAGFERVDNGAECRSSSDEIGSKTGWRRGSSTSRPNTGRLPALQGSEAVRSSSAPLSQPVARSIQVTSSRYLRSISLRPHSSEVPNSEPW
eukprot:gene7750-biopygen3712